VLALVRAGARREVVRRPGGGEQDGEQTGQGRMCKEAPGSVSERQTRAVSNRACDLQVGDGKKSVKRTFRRGCPGV